MVAESCIAMFALRIRVSMSAMGSVIVIGSPPSPRRLGHARHLSRVGELPEADPTQTELAVHRTRAATPAAPGVSAHLELRLALLLVHERLLRHALPLCFGTAEREPEGAQQGATLVVGAGGRADGDVHAAHRVDLVVIDLREDQLLGDTERVVAAPVERPRVEAAEVTDARDREADEPVVELPHPVAAQRHLGADRVALAELEAGDRLLGPGDHRLLAGDDAEVRDRAVEQRGLTGRQTDPAVEDDLLELWHLHDVAEAELLLQRRAQVARVALLEPGCHQRSFPHLRQTRTLVPSSSKR